MKNYIDFPPSLAKHSLLKFNWSICSNVYLYSVDAPVYQYKNKIHRQQGLH